MPSFLISFAVTVSLTPLVIAAARRCGWIAAPRADRWHSRPTALLGGIAIFVGTAIAWVTSGDLDLITPVALPAALVFLVGLVDDRFRIRPHAKLIAQLAATTALIAGGVSFQLLPWVIALPLTLLWVIGITNAVNLLDNMDGLAAGVSLLAALAMAACWSLQGGSGCTPAALALAGSCAAFLIYNFNPARIFMGDCGSMFLGFSLAALAMQGMHRGAPNLLLSLLVPVAVLAIPIFDTTLVSVARTLHGRSVSQGGRDHSSHRLVSLGLSERGTVLLLYALTALFGGFALLVTRLPLLVAALLGALLLTALILLGMYLGLVRVYPGEEYAPSNVRLIGGGLLHKKQLLQVLFDIHLVPVAFIGAYLLRFEGTLPIGTEHAVAAVLPVVLVAKLAAMQLARAYQGIWRYAGMRDALKGALGSTLGSLLTACALGALVDARELSRTALVIDWALFTLLAVGVRAGHPALQQVFALIPPRNGPRVLILGAGAEALPLIDRLRDPLSPRRAEVVAILDDDLGKNGRRLNGVTVLGSLSMLPALFEAKAISYCLLGVSPVSEAGERILALCHSRGIPLYTDPDVRPLSPAWREEYSLARL